MAKRQPKRSKFAKGKNGLRQFGEWVDGLENVHGSDIAPYVKDRNADDEYLKRIRHDRGAVKKLALTDPMTKNAIDYRVQLAVGNSVRIKPSILYNRLGWKEDENRDVRRNLRELWKLFMESDERWIDSSGLHTVSELATQHTRIFETEGEAMAVVNELGSARRSPLSFNISNINPARVRDPSDLPEDESRRLADGKLVSRRGYPLGFYVHEYEPRNSRAKFGRNEDWDFIPTRNSETGREQFIHSYVQATSDLSRGISKMASCLNLSCQKSQYLDSALEDAISKAGLTFVVKSNAQQLGDLMDVLGDTADDEDPMMDYMERSKIWHDKMDIKHKGSKIARLLHGEDLEGFSAQQAGGGTFEQFNDTIDTVAASCHGLSLEEYRQRWDGTNYSGARSGKLYVYNMIKALRAQAPWRFVRKIYCLFVEEMILQGRLRLPNFGSDSIGAWRFFLANKEALTCVEFFGSPKDEIDRAKTADGYLAEGQLGVGTWESYCEEVYGEYWEDRLDQIIDEVKTTYDKLKLCTGTEPDWSINEVVTNRLFAGNAFLARKELRDSGATALPNEES